MMTKILSCLLICLITARAHAAINCNSGDGARPLFSITIYEPTGYIQALVMYPVGAQPGSRPSSYTCEKSQLDNDLQTMTQYLCLADDDLEPNKNVGLFVNEATRTANFMVLGEEENDEESADNTEPRANASPREYNGLVCTPY